MFDRNFLFVTCDKKKKSFLFLFLKGVFGWVNEVVLRLDGGICTLPSVWLNHGTNSSGTIELVQFE